jgi:diadenosine tetraphosphatase ApaH/serine/threonine PP2A family protein phosphatase
VRACVISDIHGNAHALEAVLGAMSRDAPDAVWCLGDIVGYGPRPNECCAIVADTADLCLCGNHDLGVLGAIDISMFAGDAMFSALWTRRVLSRDSRAFLSSLAPQGTTPDDGVELFHASPRDPVWEYILTDQAAAAALDETTAPVVLVGHSHVALEVSLTNGRLDGGVAPDGTRVELDGRRWLLNPGSVGQPRDGDPRAAYLVLDFESRFAEFRRVAYSIEDTQAEMRSAGLPEALAVRLAFGQ